MSSPSVCPKHMVYGPCGGVRDDGECELGGLACPFTTSVAWDGPSPAPPPGDGLLADLVGAGPFVLSDLSVRPYDPVSVRTVVGILAGSCDAVLVGEHHNRPDLPPTLFAVEVMEAGGRPVTTLTCRDRNALVLEQELAGLAAVGVQAVLCVTGDGRGAGVRPGVTQVFDLDGTRLAALAAEAGLVAAVAESPEARPAGLRPERVAHKQRAGAGFCVLNHVRSPARTAQFVAAAHAAGADLPFVASVAVFTDERSARVLQSFPGLHLDDVVVEQVLTSSDPVTAGIAAAVSEARALLAIPGVAGVNLSGLASARGEEAAAEIKSAVGTQLRAA